MSQKQNSKKSEKKREPNASKEIAEIKREHLDLVKGGGVAIREDSKWP